MGKVFKNGNSLAVTVPKSYAHQLSIRSGSEIKWEKIDEGLLLKSSKKTEVAGVDQQFAQMVDGFINEHNDGLQELYKS